MRRLGYIACESRDINRHDTYSSCGGWLVVANCLWHSVITMDVSHRGIQILGFLAIVTGCGLALVIVRVLIVGHLINFWMFFGDLLFAALAAYLIYIGRRAVALPRATLDLKRDRMGHNACSSCMISSLRTPIAIFPYSDCCEAPGIFQSDPSRGGECRRNRERNRLCSFECFGDMEGVSTA